MKKILKFEAEWCKPCQDLKPIVNNLIELYPDIELEVHDMDHSVESAYQHNIMSIPTLVFEQDGVVVGKVVGFTGLDDLINKVETLFK